MHICGNLACIPSSGVRCSALMAAHADLRASALLALTKLMAIEPGFCDANLRLLFTLLHNRCVSSFACRNPHGCYILICSAH